MLDGVVVPLFQAIYTLLHFVAGICWTLNQALLIVGYYVMSLTHWLVTDAFKPVIDQVTNQTDGLLAPIFTIAMLVLAITYLLSVFTEIKIVDLRSAILWLFFAVFIFQFAPELYAGSEQLRRGLGGTFYEAGVETLAGESGSIEGLDNIGVSSQVAMETPSNQFGTFVSYDTAIDGLDIAMAYLYADGCDVLRTSGCLEMGRLPLEWYLPGSNHSYFENTKSGDFYPVMTNDERQASLSKAADGIWRAFSGMIVSCFGLLEQIVHLVLAMAMGFSFISLGIAVLFAFFKRTETITWAVFNMIIELFVQSIVTSLLLSIVLTFVIIGAGTANAVLLLGSSFVMMIFMVLLIRGALTALSRAINGLIGAMSTAVGGTLGSVTGTTGDVVGSMGAGIGAAAALYRGASYGQAFGLLAAGNQTITRAAQYGQYAFGPDSALGSFSADVFTGASAANLVGPGAAGFLMDTQQDNEEDGPASGSQPREAFDEDGNRLRTSRRRGRQTRTSALGSPVRSGGYEDDDISETGADNDQTTDLSSTQPSLTTSPETASVSSSSRLSNNAVGEGDDFASLSHRQAAPTMRALGEGLPPLVEEPRQPLMPLPNYQFKPADIEFLSGIESAFPGSTGLSFNSAGGISSADIAKIDASDDDDFANLSAELTAAVASHTPTSVATSGSEAIDTSSRSVASGSSSDDLTAIQGIGPHTQRRFNEAAIRSYEDLATSSPEALQAIEPRLKADRAERIIADAAALAPSSERKDMPSTGMDTSTGDDLTAIRGIGSNTQRRLNDAGIQTYDDLAAASPAALQGLVPRLSAENANRFVSDAASLATAPKDTDESRSSDQINKTGIPNTSAIAEPAPSISAIAGPASSALPSASAASQPESTGATPSTSSPSASFDSAAPSGSTASALNTTDAPAQIAAAVDASNNDDNARLVSGISASLNTTPDFSAISSGLAAALSGAASGVRYSTPTPDAASAVSIGSGGSVPNMPEVGQYARLANAMHLSPDTAAAVVQNTAAHGSMGAEVAASVRTALSGITTGSGGSLDTSTINSAVNGLQQTASAMVSAVNASATGANQGSVMPANLGVQTSSTAPQSPVQVNVAASFGRAPAASEGSGSSGSVGGSASSGLGNEGGA